MLREDAPASVKTVSVFGGFRDAVCVSAIDRTQSPTLTWNRAQGIAHSDAFDVYPWLLGRNNRARLGLSALSFQDYKKLNPE